MTFHKKLGMETSSQLTFTHSIIFQRGRSTTNQIIIIINHILTVYYQPVSHSRSLFLGENHMECVGWDWDVKPWDGKKRSRAVTAFGHTIDPIPKPSVNDDLR